MSAISVYSPGEDKETSRLSQCPDRSGVPVSKFLRKSSLSYVHIHCRPDGDFYGWCI